MKYFICNNYGENCWTLIRKLEDYLIKVQHCKEDLKFLKFCGKQRVTPKGLGLNKELKKVIPKSNIVKVENRIIKEVIKFKRIKERRLSYQCRKLKKKIYKDCTESGEILEWIERQVRRKVAVKLRRIKNKKQKFLFRDKEEITSSERNDWIKKQVINLTDSRISVKTERFLSKGLNFNIENKLNMKQLVYNLESIVMRSKLNNEEQIDIRDKWSNIVKKYRNKQAVNSRMNDGSNKNLDNIKEELKDITICQADKSKAVVLIDKTWEKEKIADELKKQAYKRLDYDPMFDVQKDIESIVRKGKKLGCLSKCDITRLNQKEWRYPVFKFRVKTHKEVISIRPIIDSAGGPLNNVENWIKMQIKGLNIDNSNIIGNSDELIAHLKKIRLGNDYKMASLDVTSMFTAIPHKLIIDSLSEILKDENKVNSEFLLQTINLVLEKNFFKYDDWVYQQIIGLPMGNKISPILANMVMTNFDSYMSSLNGIKFYKRYVDDTFILFNEKETGLNDIINYANEWHPEIKFTAESEVEDCLNFLDLTITRVNNMLEFRTYKKKVNTDLMINASSAAPEYIKRNTIMNYFLKILKRTSDTNIAEQEIQSVKKVAKLNGYKDLLIEKALSVAVLKAKNKNDKLTKSVENEEGDKKLYFSIEYQKGLFEKLRKVGKKFNLNLAPKANNKIKNRLTNKNKNLQKQEFDQGVVYKIQCSCKKCYIGESGRRLIDRIKEHKKDVEYCRKTSTIFEHLLENKACSIKWEDVSILKKNKELYVRKFIENEYIEKFRSLTINQNVGLAPNGAWKKILNQR